MQAKKNFHLCAMLLLTAYYVVYIPSISSHLMESLSRFLCKCERCTAQHPGGRRVSRATFFRHQAGHIRRPIPGTDQFLCRYCPSGQSEGHLTSYSTLIRHRDEARARQQGDEDACHSNLDTMEYQDCTQDCGLSTAESANSDSEPDNSPSRSEEKSPKSHYCLQISDDNISDYDQLQDDTDTPNDDSDIYQESILDDVEGEDLAIYGGEITGSIEKKDIMFVRLARMRANGITRGEYQEFRNILRICDVELPCTRSAEARLRAWTDIQPIFTDCCINSCMAFTGEDSEAGSCRFCNEQRYSGSGNPRSKFLHLPLTRRLQLQYSDPQRARMLKTYRHSFTSTTGGGDSTVLRDVFDGRLYREFHRGELGLFTDKHDIALHLSLDGVQVVNMKTHEVHPRCNDSHIQANRLGNPRDIH